MAEMQAQGPSGPVISREKLQHMSKRAGFWLSSIAAGGLVWWAGALVFRDVSEVPVIEATSEHFRSRPEAGQEGGQITPHLGLSVTQVASEGTNTSPPREIRLAPTPAEPSFIAPEVLAQTIAPAVTEPSPTPNVAENTSPEETAIALALNEALQKEPSAQLELSSASTEFAALPPSLDVANLRPQSRPTRYAPASETRTEFGAAEIEPSPNAGIAPAAPATTASVSMGDRLVQLGAFDSEASANRIWNELNASYPESFVGRPHVVQRAEVSGRTFYRLRAGGFSGLAETRRFCALMDARGVACVPVAAQPPA